MIERTTFDLRLADRATTTARINTRDWQHQGTPQQRPIRAGLAGVLIALAARLETTPAPAQRRDATPSPASPA